MLYVSHMAFSSFSFPIAFPVFTGSGTDRDAGFCQRGRGVAVHGEGDAGHRDARGRGRALQGGYSKSVPR